MNELIAQLAEQAAQDGAVLDNDTNLEVYVGDEKSYQVPASFIEAFAKLIVKECAEVAGCNGHVSGFSLGDLIKEHFGVEE